MPAAPFALPPSAFGGRLIHWNGLDAAGFAAWEFLPGMRFGERIAWWRDGADRGSPHEGLDLLFFRTGDGRRLALGPGARVPVVWAGEVVAVVRDFLGSSVFFAHEGLDARGRRLHTVLGHLEPRRGLAAGCAVLAGEEAGAVADPAGRRSAAPPHLHVTVGWVAAGGPLRLDWTALRDPARVLLLDPLPLLATA